MKTIHYPNKTKSHLVTIVPMTPFTPKSTSKLRSALHFRYSIVIPCFIPHAYLISWVIITTEYSILITIITSVFITHSTTIILFILL